MNGKALLKPSTLLAMVFCLLAAPLVSGQQLASKSAGERLPFAKIRSVQFVFSDLMTHRSTLEVECTDGGEWAFFLRSGITRLDWEGMSERVAAVHDAQGEWMDLGGHLTAELTGWHGAIGIRRHQQLSNGLGMHTGAFMRCIQLTSLLGETMEGNSGSTNWYGVVQTFPLEHEIRSLSMGAGIEWGLTWDLSEHVFLQGFIGPMFQLVHHTALSAEGEITHVVDGAIERLHHGYEAPWELVNHYAAQTGPWIRSGLTVGYEF